MKKFLLILFTLLSFSLGTTAAVEGMGDVRNLGEVKLGLKYQVEFGDSIIAVMHVERTGLLRVMSSTGDYLFPYRDDQYQDLIEYNASFYDGAQGYVISVTKGEVIYFKRPFCMNTTKVWFEMAESQLTFTSSPAVGQALLPTGRAQLELLFNMPVSTSGGTMKCLNNVVQLGAQSDNLYFLYDVKDILMNWIASGIAPGTTIEVELRDVHACVSEDIKAGENGTLRLRYKMPKEPGKLVGDNFSQRTFKSYWLPDDEEGVFRMTFTHPVNTANPGYLLLVYGSPEAMDCGSRELKGKADGYDIVYDLRDIDFSPKSFLESGNSSYITIRVSPGSILDSDGNYMYSPGSGTIASWTYELPYTYLKGSPSWEITYEDENDIDILSAGESVWLYVYNYNLVRADGILLSFDGGKYKEIIPMDEVDVEYEGNGTTASLFFTVPEVLGAYSSVTISFANLRLLTGEKPKGLSVTYPWHAEVPTNMVQNVSSALAPAVSYDLQGRRQTRRDHDNVIIENGRKSVR